MDFLSSNVEAITETKRAQNLDPLSLILSADLAELLLIAHFYDESVEQSRKTIEIEPNFVLAHNQLAQAYIQKGDPRFRRRPDLAQPILLAPTPDQAKGTIWQQILCMRRE